MRASGRCRGRDGRLGDRHRRVRRRREPRASEVSFDELVAAARRVHAYADASPRGAQPPAAGSRRVRALVGDRRAARVPAPRVDADVEALDGQGVELGPLLQRARPGAGHPEVALDQFLVLFDQQDEIGALPDSVTHSEVLDNFVKPPDPRLGVRAAAGAARPALSRGRLEEVYDRLAAVDPLLARSPARARSRAAPLPARQRQRVGQLDDVRQRPGRRGAGPRRLPPHPARGARDLAEKLEPRAKPPGARAAALTTAAERTVGRQTLVAARHRPTAQPARQAF